MLLWMETLSTDGKCREHDSGLDLVGASHPLWPAAFKIRLVISFGCEIRDR
jgi:hypothetical protein